MAERDPLELSSLSELFDRLPELLAQHPGPLRVIAGQRSARVSPDGTLVAHRDGTSNVVESVRTSYAEGVSVITVYRASTRKALLKREYPYHWNDGDRPTASEEVDDFGFSDDGKSLVVKLKTGFGPQATSREERVAIPS